MFPPEDVFVSVPRIPRYSMLNGKGEIQVADQLTLICGDHSGL